MTDCAVKCKCGAELTVKSVTRGRVLCYPCIIRQIRKDKAGYNQRISEGVQKIALESGAQYTNAKLPQAENLE